MGSVEMDTAAASAAKGNKSKTETARASHAVSKPWMRTSTSKPVRTNAVR